MPLDAAQDCPDPPRAKTLLDAALTMGHALVERAIRDQGGARWRFLEHRQDPPLLPGDSPLPAQDLWSRKAVRSAEHVATANRRLWSSGIPIGLPDVIIGAWAWGVGRVVGLGVAEEGL